MFRLPDRAGHERCGCALLGEDALASVLGANPQISAVIASGLVGLVPNCAASVAIAQLYVDGVLGSGAMMSGLAMRRGRRVAGFVPHQRFGEAEHCDSGHALLLFRVQAVCLSTLWESFFSLKGLILVLFS